MRKADFQARVRKIEIVNTMVKNRFAQTLRVILDEGDLTGENLTELRQFRPNERVLVQITPLQLDFGGPAADTAGTAAFGGGAGKEEDEDLVGELPGGEMVVECMFGSWCRGRVGRRAPQGEP